MQEMGYTDEQIKKVKEDKKITNRDDAFIIIIVPLLILWFFLS
jgi:hypothetical protein